MSYALNAFALQCSDTVGWPSGRASGLTGVVVYLERGADCLHVVQLMPLPSHNPIIFCLI